MSTPSIGAFVRHLPSGIVGVVEKHFAAGEHPTVDCEVVRLSTGDELVWREENFELVSVDAGRFFRTILVPGMSGVVRAAFEEAGKRGVDLALVQPLLRAALADAFRNRPPNIN